MRYPKKVQVYLDRLSVYVEDKATPTFDVVQMYPTKKFGATNDGLCDVRLFDLVLFNLQRKTKRTILNKDILNIEDVDVNRVAVYVDGSIIFVLNCRVMVDEFTNSVSLVQV